MKELGKKAFDNGYLASNTGCETFNKFQSSHTTNYQYDDYKKQIKKETKQRQEARQRKRNWN